MTGRPAFHRIQVVDVIEETADARSLVLAIPPRLAGEFAYRPGQFLTVRVPCLTNGSVSRCYSLSSSPGTEAAPRITVKRMGLASNWICDRVGPGTVLDILPPAGTFTPSDVDDDLLLFAGGSGITPVLSILKASLAEGRGHVALVYANRDPGSVIFAAELDALRDRHPDRLWVRHWYDATAGPPTMDALSTLVAPFLDRHAFVCGPTPYMDLVGRVLAGLGVPERRVHVERFTSAVDDLLPPTGATGAMVAGATGGQERVATAEVTMDGRTHRLAWPARTRLLDVLIAAGLNPPYSCRQGICGACACVVVAGEVELLHNEILDDEDFACGYTLACQAVPASDAVTLSYS